jgi:hypothetical protein
LALGGIKGYKDNPYLKTFTLQALNFPNFDRLKDDDPETLHNDRIDSLSLYPLMPPKAKIYT